MNTVRLTVAMTAMPVGLLTVREMIGQRVDVALQHLRVQRLDVERFDSKRKVARQHGIHVDASGEQK